MDTSKVGFYMAVQQGHAIYSIEMLNELFNYYRSTFRNSVAIFYDQAKANFGLNPLSCFRLSQTAIDCIYDINSYLRVGGGVDQKQALSSR